MAIKEGDTLPAATLAHMTADGPQELTTDAIFSGKKVVLFAVPGAFTPTCSAAHLPGFVAQTDAFFAKGVDTVACLAVNDPFVMGAWGDAHNAGKILMLADGSGVFTKALGLELDLNDRGLGIRSQRFAMIVDNGVVTKLNVESSTALEVSDADTMLAAL